jgi:hypothetical protein
VLLDRDVITADGGEYVEIPFITNVPESAGAERIRARSAWRAQADGEAEVKRLPTA